MNFVRRGLLLGWALSLLGVAPLSAVDCNQNGEEDAADIASARSEDCNENGVPDECEGLRVRLTLGEELNEVAQSPRDLAAGDVDGDGDQDLLVGSRLEGQSTLSVLRNHGDGTFEREVAYEGEGKLHAVVLDDLDGDGDLDAVSANDGAIWLFHNPGDGRFGAPVVLTPPGETRFLIAADVNGDGAPDLIAANRLAETVSVLASDGQGAFLHVSDVEVGSDPVALAAGDLDGDGDLDLAVVNRRSLDLAVLEGDGAGGFALSGRHDLGGRRPISIGLGDFDADGLLDIALTTAASYAIALNAGAGTFRQPVHYDGVGLDVAVGDADGDGDLDLVLGTRPDFVSVKLNDGRGHLGIAVDFNAPGLPSSVAIADFDADGVPDVAAMTTSPSAVSLLLNREGDTLAATTEEIDSLTGCGTCRPHSGAVADLDGDGDLDVLGATTHPGTFVPLLNDGRGRLSPGRGYVFGGERPLSTDTGDLDGDGDQDAATIDNYRHNLLVHLNLGDGRFARPRAFAVTDGGAPISVKLGDLDGDEDLDAVVANFGRRSVAVLFNQGDATFARDGLADLRVGASPHAVDLADFDADGDLDIAVANARGPQVSVLLNDGSGSFAAAVDYGPSDWANFVAAADLNGDGHVDLVTANTVLSSCSVFLGAGGGRFRPSIELGVGRAPFSVLALDFDGDRRVDLVTGNEASGTVSILLGRAPNPAGEPTFAPPVHIDTDIGTRFVIPGDYDADGDVDLVTTNRDGQSFTVIYNESVLLNAPDFLETICTPAEFQKLSVEAGAQSAAERFIKYTLPATERATLESAVYQNTRRYPLHEDFLARVFPDQFPALDPAVYDSLVGRRASRQYFVGAISRLRDRDGKVLYGASVVARFEDAAERLTAAEVEGILESLRASFRLEPLWYFPATRAAIEVARGWQDPGFDIYFGGGAVSAGYEAYTRAVGYGRVRILEENEFRAANETGQISFRDVLVLERAPRDIEGVVAGVITAEPQGELSHVAIRTNRRGSPNAFVAAALERFRPLAGELVRLEVLDTEYTIEIATEAQAEAFWATSRPRLSVDPQVDLEFAELSSLDEIAAMDSAAGGLSVEARFGGKAANLARLRSVLTGPWERYRLDGFAVPVRYYFEFLESNRLTSALAPGRQVSYREYLEELFQSSEFRSDSSFRFGALETLREHMRDDGEVGAELIERLAARVREVYADLPADHRVRFRSSSNVEDAIEFNGAGLYDSTSVCASDDLDGDDAGPSRCDPERGGERGIARGLKAVWASLWNFRAFEERAYYGIDQSVAAMAILSNKTFIGERANGVAFTGNPSNPLDRRYVITVQRGEESVVSPEPGVVAEKDIVEMANDGGVVQVARILRAVPSSLVPPGEYILSEGQLRELGALLWHIDRSFPVETGAHDRADVLLDIEFKIEATGALAVKQVRPFLLTSPAPASPAFTLEVAAASACGAFVVGRTAREEYELKSTLRLARGTLDVPTAAPFNATIVESITFGPERDVAAAAAPGLFQLVDRRLVGGGLVVYRLRYEQELQLAGGEPVQLEISGLDFRSRDGVPAARTLRLDAEALTDKVFAAASFEVDGEPVDLVFTACGHDTLPLWEIRASLADGSSVVFEERYRPELLLDSGPASLTRADVVLDGARREVTDYWSLVYSATRHNTHAVYWAVLDPPVRVGGLEALVHAVELRAPVEVANLPAAASYLGEGFEVLAPVGIDSYSKAPLLVAPGDRFRRGDANTDGDINITDAVWLLEYLFRAGPPSPCARAADANDDGKLGIVDAIAILLHLGGGTALPPPLTCGADPTPDGLLCGAGCSS